MRTTLGALGLLVLLGGAMPAVAQQIELVAPPPAPEVPRMVIPPGDHERVTRPSDADFYPLGPRVRQDPTYVGPLSVRTATGRAGVAGWTAPSVPVGSAQVTRESTGWFALGFALEWGGPPARRAPAPRQAPAARPAAR
jgi:hypothetical protein